jgi:RNA polymerase sigma factor (sigma-70 family)
MPTGELERWIKDAKLGNADAFNKLAGSCYHRIFHFCLKYFGDEDEAWDCTQKTFIKVYEKLPELREESRFFPWLYTIAGNFCKEYLRSNSKLRHLPLDHGMTPEQEKSPSRQSGADSLHRSHELNHWIEKALQSIPEEQRVVVIMKEYEGFKFHEIASILGQSENTVKSRLYYGLKALRKCFEKWNITKDELGYGYGR